ncbi:lysophospholipase [Corallococcus sp. M34]|uniref:lysophospholipase n=1 Tax=Citreicoccus inhibens TaxID=2849499 RepID=UPI001C229AC9|nr:lysophospholipase [Citreicoccus inhibens]MBU8896914.1 lysophospholipase [Citreicoccus inhibens]
MRSMLSFGIACALLGLGCGEGVVPAGEEGAWQVPAAAEVQQALTVQAGAQAQEDLTARLASQVPEREWLFGNVAHYTYRLQVGPSPYDVLVVHRVVKELLPWHALRGGKAVFMIHGDLWGFTSAFLSGARTQQVSVRQSIAAYLADEGLDVWGMDMRWVNVPLGLTNFDFMANWSMETHVQDVRVALSLARAMRQPGLGNPDRMFLLGWSRGAAVGYAYLNAESQWPRALRQVDGFIPMDMAVRFSPQDDQQRQWACDRYVQLAQTRSQKVYEGGLLGTAPGTTVKLIGQLASAAPNAPSPIPFTDGSGMAPPTNRQFAIIAAAATGSLFVPRRLNPMTPGYHLTAGIPDTSTNMPEALTFTRESYLFDYLQMSAPYQSLTEVVELEGQLCGDLDVPYDDHLKDVRVPVLYVGAAGGIGRYGEYSLSLLGSTDVTVRIIRTQSSENSRALDYGHADLFLASDAKDRVWQPIAQWIRFH